MLLCQTKYFGPLEYDASMVIQFPAGLPAFEDQTRFILIERPDLKPLVFLQSLETSGLCFLALPATAVVQDYKLELPDEEFPREASIHSDVLCLALVTIRESGPTVNLLAPVVIDLKTLRAIQAVMATSTYSHQHPLAMAAQAKDEPSCSS